MGGCGGGGEFRPDPDQLLALLMSVDEDLRRMRGQLMASRAARHAVNIVKNRQLWAKMQKWEADVRNRVGMRDNLIRARALFEKATGLTMSGSSYWRGWLDELERLVANAKTGMPVDGLRARVRALVNEAKALNALIPQDGDEAIVSVEVKTAADKRVEDERIAQLELINGEVATHAAVK